MKSRVLLLLLYLLVFELPICLASGTINLYAEYPYSMDGKVDLTTYQNGTMPLYINLENYNDNFSQLIDVEIELPVGLIAEENPAWQSWQTATGLILHRKIEIPAFYGQKFDLVYLHSENELAVGEHNILVRASGEEWQAEKVLRFVHKQNSTLDDNRSIHRTSIEANKYNWYIQSVVFPVDNQGKKDDRTQEAILYIKDMGLESFRNRMIGEGATNWAAVFHHPTAFLVLDMRNPQQDIRTLKVKAELVDKTTGRVVPGFSRASESDNESGQGWAGGNSESVVNATTALISLNGLKDQAFILPIYTDPFKILAGDYKMRLTAEGGGQEKIQEIPLKVVKERNLSFFALAFAGCCLLLLLFFLRKVTKCIKLIGAKGAITVSLFAAVAFGGIVVPTTLIGDFVQVILGPFSGLVTGLLSGVLQYLLLVSLLILYRKPGVITLLFLLKWLLAGLIFGRFTPIGILSYAVQIVVLETILYLARFYVKKELSFSYMLFIALLLGLADAFTTMINMEQMMFFYRLYYADWYIALYMLVNGLIYSSIGAMMGYKIGYKLQQVMGE
ncbi:MAG TPA: hypothetical protein IAB06_07090 [Candidatus Avacidaminococcus intestinavium]|uniref:Uncharacterized protein n=1 Tax=Candidatus Avacidaminococcus intestinavium TaxID=2840684 RepID=A0A9D1MQV9_9FIRM|nr:hypothetical protein [Candidatus Avacidaminococcus intestinavium]